VQTANRYNFIACVYTRTASSAVNGFTLCYDTEEFLPMQESMNVHTDLDRSEINSDPYWAAMSAGQQTRDETDSRTI
jgi:hypothetical protein